jgi:biopolymer transport protein ExbD
VPRRRSTEPFELNISALIDIFSIMLFFLMTTVTFLSLKTLNASVPALSEGAVDSDKGVNVSVQILPTGYKLQASGHPADASRPEMKVNLDIAKKTKLLTGKEVYDTKELTEELWKIKKVAPEVKVIMIFPESEIAFEDVVATMDASREMPSAVNPNKRVPLFTRPVLSELIK